MITEPSEYWCRIVRPGEHQYLGHRMCPITFTFLTLEANPSWISIQLHYSEWSSWFSFTSNGCQCPFLIWYLISHELPSRANPGNEELTPLQNRLNAFFTTWSRGSWNWGTCLTHLCDICMLQRRKRDIKGWEKERDHSRQEACQEGRKRSYQSWSAGLMKRLLQTLRTCWWFLWYEPILCVLGLTKYAMDLSVVTLCF